MGDLGLRGENKHLKVRSSPAPAAGLGPAQQASARFWALATLGRLALAKKELQVAEAHFEEAHSTCKRLYFK